MRFWFAFVVLFAGCAAKTQLAWAPFQSEEGNFAVDAPGAFVHSQPTAQVPNGPALEFEQFMCEAPDKSIAAAVTYVDYPLEGVKNRTPTQIMEGSRDGMLSGVKLTLRKEKRISVDGVPGLEFESESVAGGFLNYSALIVPVGARLYQLIVSTDNRVMTIEEHRKIADKFFRSFKFLDAAKRDAMVREQQKRVNEASAAKE